MPPAPARLSWCTNATHLLEGGSPVPSTLMFAAGLGGNGLALGLLAARGARGASAFGVLAAGLAATDLLGTAVLSPAVLAAYARGRTLQGLAPGLCPLFAYAMALFGLASTLVLGAMGLERCLALSHPYLYARGDGASWARRGLGGLYAFSAIFCSLPLAGLGRYRQYCPGTWCYVDMRPPAAAFSLAYAALTALLVLGVLACNGSAGRSLARMWHRRGSGGRRLQALGVQEEAQHLAQLVLVTVVFLVCSLPLVVRAFVGALAPDGRDEADLVAFRLGALNPILDPWIYILLRALPRCPRPRPRAEPGARDTDTAPAPAAELRQ
ncbi:prostacyclin receptor [Alligator mississippiensis]|uniref:Prostacyclin receptor n=2 Tax=Alligator mississippiensis TaxID=8496 RepID=A0A151P0V5_ALLMI|nr:prostacyclin receptor [Alligator mississippiensis]